MSNVPYISLLTSFYVKKPLRFEEHKNQPTSHSISHSLTTCMCL